MVVIGMIGSMRRLLAAWRLTSEEVDVDVFTVVLTVTLQGVKVAQYPLRRSYQCSDGTLCGHLVGVQEW